MNPRQRKAQIIINILVIAELCISIYLANKDPEKFTLLFFKYVSIMLIPTIILSIAVMRTLRTDEHIKTGDYKEEATSSPPMVKVPAAKRQETTIPFSGSKVLIEGRIMLDKTSRWKNLAGKAGMFFLILSALAVVDACQSRFRTPLNIFDVLPGSVVEVTGQLEKKVPLQELTYISTSDLIRLSFSEVRMGYWFGEAMWQGSLTVSPDIIPGEYRLTIFLEGHKPTPEKPAPVFLIKVYQDHLSLRQGSKSFIQRSSGISPWWFAVFCLPFIGLSSGTVFYLSVRIDHLLAKEGKAEVYRVVAGAEGSEISFGLGTRHGVKPGSLLTLFDESGRPVATGVVHRVSETNSVAIVGLDCTVKQGDIVSLDKR